VCEHGAHPVPRKLRNAVTPLMQSAGDGAGNRHPHDEGVHAPWETYLPDELVGRRYYLPKDIGLKTAIAERLRRLRGEK
jgi:putative ATPase